MPTNGNIFGDLLKISGGDIQVASDRLKQFNEYANTVPSSDVNVGEVGESARGAERSAPSHPSDHERP